MSFERPRQSEQGTDFRNVDLSGLGSEIQKYNDQYNIGTLMADQIIGSMGEEPSAKIIPEEISEKTATFLRATGLSIESVRGIGTIVGSDEDSDVHAQELRFNLDDGKRFTAYLGVLDETSITPSQAEGLKMVAESLTKQLTSHYKLDDPEDEKVIELFGSLQGIIEGYKSLDESGKNGLGESVSQLEKYLGIARQKYLREFLIVQQEQLLTTEKDRTFGPYDWHKDSTPESYRNSYWQRALDALKVVKKNPNASALFEKTTENLKAALVFAKRDLTDNAENLSLYNQDLDAFKIVIDDVYEELEQMTQEDQ